jgi:uncharacterized membrane protein
VGVEDARHLRRAEAARRAAVAGVQLPAAVGPAAAGRRHGLQVRQGQRADAAARYRRQRRRLPRQAAAAAPVAALLLRLLLLLLLVRSGLRLLGCGRRAGPCLGLLAGGEL